MKKIEIFLALLSGIYILYSAFSWESTTYLEKMFFGLSVLVLILIAINTYRQDNSDSQEKKINSVIGAITDEKTREGIMDLIIGDGGTTFRLGSGGFISANDSPLFKLSIEKDKLKLYALIRDPFGKVIAVIDKNEWTFFSKDYEYNNDKNAFEIVTAGERKVYFQIEYKNGKCHFRGGIVNSKGTGGFFCIDSPDGAAIMSPLRNNSFDLKNHLNDEQIIFKYPRQKYLSKRRS